MVYVTLKMTRLFLCIVFLFSLSSLAYGASMRVVGGNEAPERYGRYQASLQNLTGAHVCGGAVVSDRHVVTAAHCISGAEPQYIKIVVGVSNLDRQVKQYDVASMDVYVDFDFGLRTNDIAVIKAAEPFDLEAVDILDLYQDALKEGDPVILTGFGATEVNGESTRTLHHLNLTVFNQETCQYAMRYTREVDDSMFCTFTTIGEGTCSGDSGSPLVKDNKLAGVVSWGIPCAVGFPDVHTRITNYIQWIQQVISKS